MTKSELTAALERASIRREVAADMFNSAPGGREFRDAVIGEYIKAMHEVRWLKAAIAAIDA